MPKPAYVILNSTGTVVRAHYAPTNTGALPANPSANPSDLETIILDGYSPVRETPLDGGGMLIVLQK
jgi:hypothetical protein